MHKVPYYHMFWMRQNTYYDTSHLLLLLSMTIGIDRLPPHIPSLVYEITSASPNLPAEIRPPAYSYLLHTPESLSEERAELRGTDTGAGQAPKYLVHNSPCSVLTTLSNA